MLYIYSLPEGMHCIFAVSEDWGDPVVFLCWCFFFLGGREKTFQLQNGFPSKTLGAFADSAEVIFKCHGWCGPDMKIASRWFLLGDWSKIHDNTIFWAVNTYQPAILGSGCQGSSSPYASEIWQVVLEDCQPFFFSHIAIFFSSTLQW